MDWPMRRTGRAGQGLRQRRLCRTLGGMTLTLACISAAVLAANGDAENQAQDRFDVSPYCLPVQGQVTDAAPLLRLAAPPMDTRPGRNIGQAMFSRLMGSGALAQSAASQAQAGPPGLNVLFGTPAPSIKLLFDGSADLKSGRHATAQRQLSDCVQLAAQQQDSLVEAACANNLAVAHAATGRPAQARAEFERALRLYQTPRSPPTDVGVPPAMQSMFDVIRGQLAGQDRLEPMLAGMSPEQRAQYQASIRDYQARMSPQGLAASPQVREAMIGAWRRFDHLNTRRGIELAQLNLGNLALASGQLAEAQTWLQAALDSHPADENPQCRAAAAMDLARFFRRRDRVADSQALLARYPAAPRRKPTGPGDDDGSLSVVELGAISLAAANTDQASPGSAPTPPPISASVTPKLTPAFVLNDASGRFGDAALAQLLADATRDGVTQAPAKAQQTWRRLALRATAGQRPDLAYSAHAALMRLHAGQGDAAAAVFHGKTAANLAQTTRANLSDASPSRDGRRAFLRERRQVYVTLTQLLLDQQRLAEAEAVLQLLKEDEGQQFIGGAGASLGSLALTAAEQGRQRQDDEAARQLRQADQGRLAAAAAMPMGSGALSMLSPVQIEAARLKSALALPGVAAQLRREPLRPYGNDEASMALLRDVQDFFLGPQRRAERFLAHVIEDAPRFDPPASAQDRAALVDIQRRLPQITAELAPLLRAVGPAKSTVGSVSFRPAGSAKDEDDRFKAINYVAVEPVERLWRNLRDSDEIEARYLQRSAGGEVPTNVAKAATTGPVLAPDDTLALLARQPVATALLYYLPGDQRLDVLLVSAKGRRHVRIALPRAELDASVDAFVKLLRRSERDPRPAALALYQRLFGPVAQAVADSGARVLALSLADKLRFVPFAALHDGQGWLVERYALALHPGGALAGRLKPASPNWRAAAFGASIGGGEFAPLLNVRSEIASVVRHDGAPGGVLPGEAWLDQGFTGQRLREALAGGAKVLHIASHFKFVGGDAAASYLLLGDGAKLSLRELSGPAYRFDRTELVTLSACTTGLSADDTFGQEVDGLAALLMGQGAASVLASLWEVNDKSTASLMASVYRLRESQQLSRALALQQAQLAMIRAAGTAAPSPIAADAQARSVSRVRLPGDPEPDPADSAFAPPAALGYGHPFYWAAFVLMGNWL